MEKWGGFFCRNMRSDQPLFLQEHTLSVIFIKGKTIREEKMAYVPVNETMFKKLHQGQKVWVSRWKYPTCCNKTVVTVYHKYDDSQKKEVRVSKRWWLALCLIPTV